jgi:exodeoxyribonuclease-3
MPLKIATWNVNSILARLPTALKVLEAVDADIWCLQELKCEDPRFPRLEFEALGYNIEALGQRAITASPSSRSTASRISCAACRA